MSKGAVETKERAKPDVFVDVYGKQHKRVALEDPERPGHLREGLLLDPGAWSAAQHFNLRTPSGLSVGFISPSRDPREPRREEAPQNLLAAVATAQAAVDAYCVRKRAGADAVIEARLEQQAAASRQDRAAYDTAIVADRQAMEEYRTVSAEEPLVSKRLADAEQKIREWTHDERCYRFGLAGRPEASTGIF